MRKVRSGAVNEISETPGSDLVFRESLASRVRDLGTIDIDHPAELRHFGNLTLVEIRDQVRHWNINVVTIPNGGYGFTRCLTIGDQETTSRKSGWKVFSSICAAMAAVLLLGAMVALFIFSGI